jgi:hypothetical protein
LKRLAIRVAEGQDFAFIVQVFPGPGYPLCPTFEYTLKPVYMHVYDTVSAAVNGLKTRGYETDFNLSENCLICHDDKYDIKDFDIVEVYRFEGNTDPADEAVVYAIESNNGKKGVLVTGYGATAEGMSAEMVKKLSMERAHDRDN